MTEITRKALIIQKYVRVQNELKPHLADTPLLPNIEDIDIIDLLYYLNLYFYSDDIETSIRILLNTKAIKFDSDEVKTKVIEIIKPFIYWLKNFK
jgi:alpha-L-arabinofuranosidase